VETFVDVDRVRLDGVPVRILNSMFGMAGLVMLKPACPSCKEGQKLGARSIARRQQRLLCRTAETSRSRTRCLHRKDEVPRYDSQRICCIGVSLTLCQQDLLYTCLVYVMTT
jgi:hypothetical protein